MPTEWTDWEKVSAIIASVDEEIAVARTADVIGYAGDLAPGIQVLATVRFASLTLDRRAEDQDWLVIGEAEDVWSASDR